MKNIEAGRIEANYVIDSSIIQMQHAKWWLMPMGDKDFRIGLESAPNWFHRFMQRVVFGFRYEREKKRDGE